MATLPVYVLTVYDDDDVTPLFAVGTDPGHANPYLKTPTSFPEQEIDFARGSASIGQMTVQVVDVPTVATDQDTGWLTAQLATAAGYSALMGARAVLTEDLGSGAATVLDGVIRSVRLLETFATYALELRDIRERERKTKAFVNTTTPTVVPRGVLDGYGVSTTIPFFGGTLYNPIAPAQPYKATYHQLTATRGEIRFLVEGQTYYERLPILTDLQREVLESVAFVEGATWKFDRWRILWRDTALGGAYSLLEEVASQHPDLPYGGGTGPFVAAGHGREHLLYGIKVNNVISGDTLPASGQAIDVIVGYTGPPTREFPYHLQGLTLGELLRNLYRGDYSDEPPRIRYEEAALLAMTTPVRARIFEEVEDARAWAEKHAYPIGHAAPTLNDDGEISPTTYLLPDASETLPNLDDANCRELGGGWNHGSEDTVNLVRVKYRREYAVASELPPEERAAFHASGDGVAAREVIHEFPVQASIDILGEQVLEIDSVLLTTVGGALGQPLYGDASDERGRQVAELVARMATDRFAFGGQYFRLAGDRSDADVEALKVGAWVTVAVSWMPDYGTGERNLNRLAQVMSRRNLDGAWTELGLVDAGTANAPLAGPTLGTVTADATGVVSIPVTALGAGSECRVDYAISTLEPAAGSELWRFAGPRVDSVPTTVTTPPAPEGETVWVRARSEQLGRRPSIWTTAVSVVIADVPRVHDIRLFVDPDTGLPTVRWIPNGACLGVRFRYEEHAAGEVPTFPDGPIDVDASALSHDFTLATPTMFGRVFSVELEPWTGWTGSAVSGSAGPRVERRERGSLRFTELELKLPPAENLAIYLPMDELAGTTLRDRSGNARDATPESSGAAAVTWGPGVAGGALQFPGAGKGYVLLDDSEADALGSQFYVCYWFKCTTTTGGGSARGITRDVSDYWLILHDQDEAFPQDLWFYYSPTQSLEILDLVASGEWHFVLAQWDTSAATVELWFGRQGGELSRVFRSESVDAFLGTTRPIVLGSNTEAVVSPNNPFEGSIDDVRIGSGFLTHAEVYSLFRLPGVTSQSPDTIRPEVIVKTSQAGGVGTLTLEVQDPNGVVTATAFEPVSGQGDFDVSTDPSTWAIWDTSAPFTLSDTVAIDTSKHVARIAWAVRYTDGSGASVFIRGVESFDPDTIPELRGVQIGFTDDGNVLLSWTGDEDFAKGYVTIGLGASPSDPTSSVNDGELVGQSGSLEFDGTGTTTLKSPDPGVLVFVKVLPENGAAELGTVAGTFSRRRGDTQWVAPRVEAELDRDAQGVATLWLRINDPSGSIQSPGPEFSKRAGSQAGDVWSAFATTWDTIPGSPPPYNGVWAEGFGVPDGEEAGIRWRVTFLDENGDSHTIGDTLYSTAVDELSTTVYYPYTQAIELATQQELEPRFGYLRPMTTGVTAFILGLFLPVGVTITDYAVRMYRETTSDSATFQLRYLSNAGLPTQLGTTRTHATTGWATLSDSAPNHTVAAEQTIQGVINLDAAASAGDARFIYLSITFTRHTFAEEL